ncbi:MAG: hypothetical protein PHN75_15580 [Syntrophales bacterium]|nr:hypothetical protein [Syntrophales bacterium]
MTQKQNIRILLIFSLCCISLGGLMLHFRIHPPGELPGNIIPTAAGLISILIIIPLFCFRRTAAYAYVLNGMIVIIGTIGMFHFSLRHLPPVLTFQAIIFKSLLADIIVLWGKFAVGKALFELDLLKKAEDAARSGRYFRYPNMGWWWVHLAALSIVYTLGNQLWR